MTTAKILLYILIINSTFVHSKDYVIDSKANILDEIQISPSSKWALDGGVFQAPVNTIYLNNNGSYTLLVLDQHGEISSHNITIVNGNEDDKNAINSLVIDNKAPLLDYKWENVIYKDNQVVVGPKSKLNWHVDDPKSDVKIYINDQLSDTKNNPIHITENMANIRIQTQDDYHNIAETIILFMSDFSAPEISWELESPSLLHNNQWYANKKAGLNILNPGLNTYQINGLPIPKGTSVIEIFNNSTITAFDELGNQSNEKVKWLEGKLSPQLTVDTLGETYVSPQKMKVKVGQKINIQMKDEIVGALNSEYFSAGREWLPLPKSFVFVRTGLYKLKLKSNNKLGNELLADIVFKITL